MSHLRLQLANYRLTTAHIFYHMPDHPRLLQEFIWQELDLAPKFPMLTRFLEFWQRQLDGRLHSVRVAQSQLIKPAEFTAVNGMLHLH
ncbi:MAG: usg protein [Rhodospirillaceae bacterium]